MCSRLHESTNISNFTFCGLLKLAECACECNSCNGNSMISTFLHSVIVNVSVPWSYDLMIITAIEVNF